MITFSLWFYGFFCNGYTSSVFHFLGAYYSFMVVHDASHRVASRWWGRLSALPLGMSYDEFAILHRRHHANVNDKRLDPDYTMQRLHPLCWLFAPEIYLHYFLTRKIGLSLNQRVGGGIRYLVIVGSYMVFSRTHGVRWVLIHLVGPSRCALMLLVYLLDVLPHRNLSEGQTRNLWTEERAPYWLECLTQKQCYHAEHHRRPHIRTLEL